MNLMKSRCVACVTVLGLVVTAVAVYHAFGAGAFRDQPPIVVTVNLSSVLEKLDQRAEAEAELSALQSKLREEDEGKKSELTKLEGELTTMEEGPEKEKRLDEMALGRRLYEAWARFTVDNMDIERSLQLQDLYRSIKSAAGGMAATAGYDIVLVNDSWGELSTSRDSPLTREAQIRQQIVDRQMLYANPAYDVTNDLITWMNNARKAAGAGQ